MTALKSDTGIGKRLIFTVCTGRCGTGYLARMLALLPDVAAGHEPTPLFESVMRAAQADPRIAKQFLLEQKLPAIARHPQPVYVETSHLYCKGFFDRALEMGLPHDLLLISRPHRHVATSMFRLDTIPGRTPLGLKFYLSPDDPGVLSLPDWGQLNDYQLCYWYCLEIHRRQQSYAARLSERGAGRIFKTTFSELIQPGGIEQLVDSLELARPTGWRQWRWRLQAGRVVNRRRFVRAAPAEDECDAWEREVIEQVAAADLRAA